MTIEFAEMNPMKKGLESRVIKLPSVVFLFYNVSEFENLSKFPWYL